MNILLVNDDGIESAGLHVMAQTLGKVHNVTVCAPHAECSGYSHHILFHKPVYYKRVDLEGAIDAYSLEGTPADCVMFAIRQLKLTPDFIISGPNRGANLANDIIYSGTVAAAQEGAILGYKSIAVSCCAFRDNIWQTCADFILHNLPRFSSYDFSNRILNINVPNLPMEHIKGVRVTCQGIRPYNDYYTTQEIDGRTGYLLEGLPADVVNPSEDWDILAVMSDYISVSPLTLDRTDYSAMSQLEDIVK